MEAQKKKKKGGGGLLLVALLALGALLMGAKKGTPGPGPSPSPTYTSFLSTINLVTTLEALEAARAGFEAALAQGAITLAEYQALLEAYLAKKANLTGGVGPSPAYTSFLSAIALSTTLEQLEAVRAGFEPALAQGAITEAEYQLLLEAYLARKAALTGGGTAGPVLTAGILVVT